MFQRSAWERTARRLLPPEPQSLGTRSNGVPAHPSSEPVRGASIPLLTRWVGIEAMSLRPLHRIHGNWGYCNRMGKIVISNFMIDEQIPLTSRNTFRYSIVVNRSSGFSFLKSIEISTHRGFWGLGKILRLCLIQRLKIAD